MVGAALALVLLHELAPEAERDVRASVRFKETNMQVITMIGVQYTAD